MIRNHVIALHCSGGSGRQWKALSQIFGSRLRSPDFIGCRTTGHWIGERAFTLADDAAAILRLMDTIDAPVHLVGHSYGGAIALKIACARPAQIASLALYEPTPLHLLKGAGSGAEPILADVVAVSAAIDRAVLIGDHRAAARTMVDYWNAPGAWDTLRDEQKTDVIRYVPKACLDFRAVLGERTALTTYRHLRCPCLVMQGEQAHPAAEFATRRLVHALRFAPPHTIPGAGHMGPITHADQVAGMIADFIRRHDEEDAGVAAAARAA